MVKPVVMDFEYTVKNTHTTKNTEPELSFVSILKDTLQNKEATNAAYTQKDSATLEKDKNVSPSSLQALKNENNDTLEQDKTNAALHKKGNTEKNNDSKQDVQNTSERVIADRRNEQKDEVYVEKTNVMQSMAGLSLHAHNMRAIVTDKNIHTTKHSVYKKDEFHTINLRKTFINTNHNFLANSTVTKKSGKESLHDIINQLQKLTDGQNNAKDLKKSDLKQLIAHLSTLQHVGKKDLHNALIARPMTHYNELSDSKNKNKKVARNDAHTMHAADKAHKAVKNAEIMLADAVKQKVKAEDAPKADKKGQATERNESFIQINTKQHNTTTNTVQAKPVTNAEFMQLLNRAKVMQEGEKTSLSLKLYPESLGKLSVNLGLEHGILSGRFIVESQEAKELLLQQLESIRWELEHNGVTVGEFEVNVKQQRQREFTEIPGLSHKHGTENAEYEAVSNRYIYHDGLLDVII